MLDFFLVFFLFFIDSFFLPFLIFFVWVFLLILEGMGWLVDGTNLFGGLLGAFGSYFGVGHWIENMSVLLVLFDLETPRETHS